MHDVCQIHGKSYYLILNYIFKNEFYNSLKYVYDLYIIWKAFVNVETWKYIKDFLANGDNSGTKERCVCVCVSLTGNYQSTILCLP